MTEDQARILIGTLVGPGEKLAWVGVPAPFTAAMRSPLLHLLSAVFIVCFSAFWIWSASQAAGKNNTPVGMLFPLFGLIPLSFGLYRLLQAASAIGRCWTTAYAVTTRRLLIASGRGGPVYSLWPNALQTMERSGGKDTGTISFEPKAPFFQYGGRWGQAAFKPPFEFAGIRNPAGVEALIYKTLIKPLREGEAA